MANEEMAEKFLDRLGEMAEARSKEVREVLGDSPWCGSTDGCVIFRALDIIAKAEGGE